MALQVTEGNFGVKGGDTVAMLAAPFLGTASLAAAGTYTCKGTGPMCCVYLLADTAANVFHIGNAAITLKLASNASILLSLPQGTVITCVS